MLLNKSISCRVLVIGIAAAGYITLSGCSMLGSLTKPEQAVPVSTTASTTSTSEPVSTPKTTTPAPTQNLTKQQPSQPAQSVTVKEQPKPVQKAPEQTPAQKNTPAPVRKSPVSAPAVKTEAPTPTAPERKIAPSALSRELNGEWVITSVGSQTIHRDDSMPYLTFDASTGRFYSSNGCNVLNGTYSVTENRITFANVLSTMKYCPDVDFDTAINNVIRDGNTVVGMVKRISTDTYLYLNDSSGKALMTLVHHNMSFLNGQWQVVNINSQPINDDEANIFFDIPSLKIHGNTGCNFFNGSILIDPAVPGSISFSGMAVTRMACPKGDQERVMLVALEETVSAIADGKDHVLLIDEAGNPVIRLVRVKTDD